MKFEIENFRQWDTNATFTVKTEGGMYYECKLVFSDKGNFVTSAQSRKYTKKDGSTGYANAFGALKDSQASRFFDDVATQVTAMCNVEDTFKDDSQIPF